MYPNLVPQLKSAGLFTWGENLDGQLGDNTQISKSTPVQTITGGTNWSSFACGRNYVASIKTDGTLWTWGYNSNGQLGNNTITHRSSPVQTIAGGTNWSVVACGERHTAAIKTDGTLWTWGDNGYKLIGGNGYYITIGGNGQLGDNTFTNRSSPVQTIAGGTNWSKVACGGGQNLSSGHTAAIKTDGTLWMWGSNYYGQLGDNTITHRSSPVQTIAGGTNWSSVSCGGDGTAAIKIDGTLWVWGRNIYGRIGDNTTADRSSPVQTIAGGTNWSKVACGYFHTAAIKTDGTLWTWGDGQFGELGNNSGGGRNSPGQMVTFGSNWTKLACGKHHTAAIKTDGTLWVWGLNNSGQLGDNTTVHRSSPIQTISGGTTWKQVAGGYRHTVAIRDFNY